MNSFLSRDWAGLAIGLVALVVARFGYKFARGRTQPWPRRIFTGVGGALMALTALMVVGSIYHIYQVARRHPPPGKRYDVGGYRMHLRADGESRATASGGQSPTVIWIPGGYEQGYGLVHLHNAIARETRSIIYDRAGTGWSDVGPFPRTIATDVAELGRLLDAAGEKGPFVLVGHSWGGLLANNFAAAFPDRIAGLVLLEATPPANLTSSLGAQGLGQYASMLKLQATLQLFGADWLVTRVAGLERNPEYQRVMGLIKQRLGGSYDMVSRNEARASSGIATASSFASAIAAPDSQVTREGALGAVPLMSLLRSDIMGDLEPMKAALMKQYGIKEEGWSGFVAEQKRLNEVMQHQVERFSTRGQLVALPTGLSHNFPYEDPDYTLGKVREMLTLLARGGGADSTLAAGASR